MNKINDCIYNLELQIRWIEDIDAHKFPGWKMTVGAMQQAVGVLKAQEPRVMPLEVACGEDYCYLERFNIDQVEPVSVVMHGIIYGDQHLIELYRVGREGPELMREDGYCTHWRCWDKWPSDEDRRETPWN